MDVTQLLTSVKNSFCKIFNICNLAWSPRFWYKTSQQLVLQFTQEITSALSQLEEASTQKHGNGLSLSKNPQNTEGDHREELRAELRWLQDISISSIRRLQRVEEQMEKLESELCKEKEEWNTKYHELMAEQHIVKVQNSIIKIKDTQRLESKMDVPADATNGDMKCMKDVRQAISKEVGEHEIQPSTDGTRSSEGLSSLTSCLCRSRFACTNLVRTYAWTNSKNLSVFVPRSPLDLKIGSRVKVLLPSGRIGTGGVCTMGLLPEKAELQVGVHLDEPENQQCKVVIEGQHLSSGNQDNGISVPFSKVLMVWE
ncbi:uncharacterized protein LOC121400602 [Xenopus laevis]|uniref:Uncharacterized protein LOC121400602 n=2 Tax=Xenopus laevis TaxID=8355 RepID=A0A1L8H812_XENLA|nr:uncharacterized protein LOC121400602 [Xenopus laevis]OCT92141.1 hypothetical protein XELAEV_18015195mg [Xenopus laevis]